MKIALVGNCQVGAYSAILRDSGLDLDPVAVEVWKLPKRQYEEQLKAIDACDIILTQPHKADHYGDFRTGLFRERFGRDRVFVYHNLFFTGAIPDCFGLPGVGGPMGGCHSRVVLDAYLQGRSEAEALENLETLTGIDCERAWAGSMQQFRTREKAVDVPFADELETLSRQERCFHTHNHPTGAFAARYLEKILRQTLGQEVRLGDGGDPLGAYGSWPVMTVTAESLGLPYQSPRTVLPAGRSPRVMTLKDMVAEYYAVYQKADRSALQASVQPFKSR